MLLSPGCQHDVGAHHARVVQIQAISPLVQSVQRLEAHDFADLVELLLDSQANLPEIVESESHQSGTVSGVPAFTANQAGIHKLGPVGDIDLASFPQCEMGHAFESPASG